MGYHESKGSRAWILEGGVSFDIWTLEESASHHIIARQRGKFASERSKIPRLTSPKPKFCQNRIKRGTLISFKILHMDFPGDPAAIQ